jgi:simple sugar transport system ATP-binding protein/ribose transport system ATP-binding protein
MNAPAAVVSVEGICKSYGATRAVREVTLDIPRGSVFGLVGENGAGKSTLAKMMAGIESPDSGLLTILGREVSLRDPHEGIKAGVSMMAQEIMLVPDASVEQNVMLGAMPRRGPFPDRKLMRRRYNELVALTEFDLDPDMKVGRLRTADQQKVEIMRALSQNADMIIMDEPSAALTTDEVGRLHRAIREIAKRGSTVLLISHFLEEVLTLTDRVAIMRDGALVRVGPTAGETVESLVASMVGRALDTDYHQEKPQARGRVRLSVSHLSRTGLLDDITFNVHEGEILGLAGLIGSGRTEIARCIFGADPFDAGEIALDGVAMRIKSPHQAIEQGLFMIPESRKDEGLVLGSSITDNLLLATHKKRSRAGWISRRSQRAAASALATDVDLRFGSVDQEVGSLSGGNQQKVLFGRAAEADPRVLIVDEPTRGVDIAAKRAIHETLESMAAKGVAVLFISSELEEVLGVCSRVLVMHRGRVQAEFQSPFDQERVVSAFFGGSGLPHD